MKKSTSFYIQSAFRKIHNSSARDKGCKLTKDECRAISIHPIIPDAIGNYDEWLFDKYGNIIEE